MYISNRARYYNPGSGRFLSEDPIGFNSGDYNEYRYVLNKTLIFVDPSGEIFGSVRPSDYCPSLKECPNTKNECFSESEISPVDAVAYQFQCAEERWFGDGDEQEDNSSPIAVFEPSPYMCM